MVPEIRISAFITITDPERRSDLYKECIQSALGFCDEVVIVDGGSDDPSLQWIADLNDDRIKITYRPWPKEFSWPLIGQAFQYGYDCCTGDWVIHLDCDFIFHEQDYKNIGRTFNANKDAPALSFWKYQFILPDRYNLKSRLIIAVNKAKFGDRIKFDAGGEQDLAQPALDGKYLSPDDIPEARVPFYNYEKLLKTKEQIAEDQGRMERAWQRHFGNYQMGSDGTDAVAYEKWIAAQQGKFAKPQKHLRLDEHPEVMRETIENLKLEQFGYSGFGAFRVNAYAKETSHDC